MGIMEQVKNPKNERPKPTTVRMWEDHIWPFLTKSRKRQAIVAAFAAVLVLLLGLVFRDYFEHRNVVRSLEKVQQQLRDSEQRAIIDSDCGRGQEKYGLGAKTCQVSLGGKLDVGPGEDAVRIISVYHKAIESSGDFEVIKQPYDPEADTDDPVIFSVANGEYTHARTGKHCYLRYQFTERISNVHFICDDDYLYNHLPGS